MRYEFGEFIFDPARQDLLREGRSVHLTWKAMQLLTILIEKRPAVVSHQELHDRIWSDVVVVEANLKNLVADLRAALDDHQREGRFLRTVHSRGYAFTDEVVVSRLGGRRQERLVFLTRDGQRIFLQPGENLIGRGGDSNIVIDEHEISRHHTRIVVQPNHVFLQDLASRNGTFVRGERVSERVELFDGDEVRLGHLQLAVRILEHTDETTTASSD